MKIFLLCLYGLCFLESVRSNPFQNDQRVKRKACGKKMPTTPVPPGVETIEERSKRNTVELGALPEPFIRNRRNPEFEDMIGGMAAAAAGIIESGLDLASQGAGAEDTRSFEAENAFGKVKMDATAKAGTGNVMNNNRRKRKACGKNKATTPSPEGVEPIQDRVKRSPQAPGSGPPDGENSKQRGGGGCGGGPGGRGKRPPPPDGVSPPTDPDSMIAANQDATAMRRKRQSDVNDPDNVRTKKGDAAEKLKTVFKKIMDSFAEMAKKIGQVFSPNSGATDNTK